MNNYNSLLLTIWCIFYAGIANRALRPTLGLVDPLHMNHMPYNVTVFSGFDVLWSVSSHYDCVAYPMVTIVAMQ